MSEDKKVKFTEDEQNKLSKLSVGGIAFALVLAFIIAIVGLALGAAALAKAEQNAPEAQVKTLQTEVGTLTSSVNALNSVFSDNYTTLNVNDLKFNNGWGITSTGSEFHFYGINTSGASNQAPCTYMFIKNQGKDQGKAFYLVGTGQPSQLGAQSMSASDQNAALHANLTKCANPYSFD